MISAACRKESISTASSKPIPAKSRLIPRRWWRGRVSNAANAQATWSYRSRRLLIPAARPVLKRSLSHLRSRIGRSVRFIRDRTANSGCAAAPLDPRLVEHSSWPMSPSERPSPRRRREPVVARTPAVRPQRWRAILALFGLSQQLFQERTSTSLIGRSNGITRHRLLRARRRTSTGGHERLSRTRLQSPLSLRRQLRKTPRSLQPLRNPDRHRIAPLIRALRLRRRTSQPNLRAPHRQHGRKTSPRAELWQTWPARGG